MKTETGMQDRTRRTLEAIAEGDRYTPGQQKYAAYILDIYEQGALGDDFHLVLFYEAMDLHREIARALKSGMGIAQRGDILEKLEANADVLHKVLNSL